MSSRLRRLIGASSLPGRGALADVMLEQRRISARVVSGDVGTAAGELALVASMYALHTARPFSGWPQLWPSSWGSSWWTPKAAPRDLLVRAAAMLLIEIERGDSVAAPARDDTEWRDMSSLPRDRDDTYLVRVQSGDRVFVEKAWIDPKSDDEWRSDTLELVEVGGWRVTGWRPWPRM